MEVDLLYQMAKQKLKNVQFKKGVKDNNVNVFL